MSEIKLYEAWSIADNFMGFNQVRIYWFTCERAEPLRLPYEDLVDGYWDLDQHGRQYTEGALQEALTENELAGLREYLNREHEDDLKWRQLSLPLKGSIGPISAMADIRQLLSIYREDNYSLPIKIEGYFDLELAIPALIEEISLKAVEITLQHYEPAPAPDRQKIRESILDLYLCHGLYFDEIPGEAGAKIRFNSYQLNTYLELLASRLEITWPKKDMPYWPPLSEKLKALGLYIQQREG